MNFIDWGKRKWQEWNPWGHASRQSVQEPDNENTQDYPSTRIEQEGAGVVAVDEGNRSGITPAEKQRMGNEIREAQGLRAQEQWQEQEKPKQESESELKQESQEEAKPIVRSQSARELLADIRRDQGITEQVREQRDRAKALELQQGGIER